MPSAAPRGPSAALRRGPARARDDFAARLAMALGALALGALPLAAPAGARGFGGGGFGGFHGGFGGDGFGGGGFGGGGFEMHGPRMNADPGFNAAPAFNRPIPPGHPFGPPPGPPFGPEPHPPGPPLPLPPGPPLPYPPYHPGYWPGPYYPAGWWGGEAAGAAITAAAIGSYIYSLPEDCTQVMVSNVTYQQCGPNWYMPQFQGGQIVYEVVANPN